MTKEQTIFFVIIILFMNSLTAQRFSKKEISTVDKIALQLPDSLTKTTVGISNYITTNFKTDQG